jgi:hypothetical protein
MLIGFQWGDVIDGVGDDLAREAHRGLRREDEGPAREVFLDDVVLGRAAELRGGAALALGGRDVEGEQPGRGRVDRHRRVHLLEGDVLEEQGHVVDVADRDADLADLAAGQEMVRVVAGLGREIEGDGEARLPLREVAAVEGVARPGRGMARVGPEEPGRFAPARARGGRVVRFGGRGLRGRLAGAGGQGSSVWGGIRGGDPK